MTKPFNVFITCSHCGRRTTAETAFGRHVRNHPALASDKGIVRTDCDHTFLRYKTHEQGRDFQLMMDLEVKEYGAEPDESQRDILLMKHQLIFHRGKNMHAAKTVLTRWILSTRNGRKVRLRYLGYHLLQFEKTYWGDSTWIKWDRVLISEDQLIGLLAFELDPNDPNRTMNELLRDRHAPQPPDLFGFHGR